MNDNIVFFGPTHSGKSTLLGYMKSYDLSDEEYALENKRIKERIEEIDGKSYRQDRVLAYYVDTGIDEIKTFDKGETSLGGSKRIHMSKVASGFDMNCTFIDTPGSDMGWRDKYEGTFLGDIGVFIVDIGELEKLENLKNNVDSKKSINKYSSMSSRLFSPIYIWQCYKKMSRLIIAVSKVDMVNYQQNRVIKVINMLKAQDILSDIPIVPISIDVKNRTSNNIVPNTVKDMSWYKGPSLVEELKRLINEDQKGKTTEGILFAKVERFFERTKSNNQPALRVKVLNGAIHLGDTISVGPVEVYDEVGYISGKVKSLRYETREDTEVILKGQIGGVILSRVSFNGDRISLRDAEQKRTCIVFNDAAERTEGNLLEFEINAEKLSEENVYSLMEVNERLKNEPNKVIRLNLIWFGKVISMHVMKSTEANNVFTLILQNTVPKHRPSIFTLPLNGEGDLIFKEYIIQLENKGFVPAKLIHISMNVM